MNSGVKLIALERARQVRKENWSADHDDSHTSDEMAIAAACYALPVDLRVKSIWKSTLLSLLWPWDECWWKPARRGGGLSRRVRELVKAGALIAAEIDRLQRKDSPS